MAYASKKSKQQMKEERNEQVKRDALALASLILDIYRDKKRTEKSNDVS
jgi:hypothetical protein